MNENDWLVQHFAKQSKPGLRPFLAQRVTAIARPQPNRAKLGIVWLAVLVLCAAALLVAPVSYPVVLAVLFACLPLAFPGMPPARELQGFVSLLLVGRRKRTQSFFRQETFR